MTARDALSITLINEPEQIRKRLDFFESMWKEILARVLLAANAGERHASISDYGRMGVGDLINERIKRDGYTLERSVTSCGGMQTVNEIGFICWYL